MLSPTTITKRRHVASDLARAKRKCSRISEISSSVDQSNFHESRDARTGKRERDLPAVICGIGTGGTMPGNRSVVLSVVTNCDPMRS